MPVATLTVVLQCVQNTAVSSNPAIVMTGDPVQFDLEPPKPFDPVADIGQMRGCDPVGIGAGLVRAVGQGDQVTDRPDFQTKIPRMFDKREPPQPVAIITALAAIGSLGIWQ